MEKINYQKQQDEIIKSLKSTPKILLHSCCGPCSSYCLEALNQYFDICVHWYNPNIYPESEYSLRLENQKKIIDSIPKKNKIEIFVDKFDFEQYYEYVSGLENEPEGGSRCTKCFIYRMERCAYIAKEQGFDYFTTTLTVSPHKDAERINSIGRKLAEKYGVKFLPSDFKKKNGYLRSIELSKQYDLYRQNYCGCKYSLR